MPAPSPAVETPSATNAVPPHLTGMLAVSLACVVAEAALWFLSRPAPAAPSMLMVVAGLGGLFFGAWAIYRINNSNGRLWGRFGALLLMTAGLSAVPLFAYQFAGWEAAMEKHEIANMRSIALACVRYAIHHKYCYPPSLAALLAAGTISPRMLSNPMHGMTPMRLPAKLTPANWRSIAQSVDDQSDYQYIGADLTMPLSVGDQPLAGKIMLLYRNEQNFDNAGPIAFADGSVHWIKASKMIAVEKASNAARQALGLPVVTFFSNAPSAPARKP